jgi:hypothetical protein
MANEYHAPQSYNRFTIEEAKEYLKDTGDPEFQKRMDALCHYVADKFPPVAGLGVDGARELLVALLLKGLL